MLSLVCVIAVGQVTRPPIIPSPHYNPTGPQIEVTLKSGGKFVITTDSKNAPLTSQRILELANDKFFDNQRVFNADNVLTTWGDSSTEQGVDTKMFSFSGQQTFEPPKVAFTRGVVGLFAPKPKTAGGSLLFVVKKDALSINGWYTAIGKVTDGMHVVDSMTRNDWVVSARPVVAAPK